MIRRLSLSLFIFSLFVFFSLTRPVGSHAQTWAVDSPDHKVLVTITNAAALTYSVQYENNPVIQTSALGFAFKFPDIDYSTNLQFIQEQNGSLSQPYTSVVGKRSQRNFIANTKTLTFKNQSSARQFNLEFRVANDGFAFRYVFLGTGIWDGEYWSTSELSSFKVPSQSRIWYKPGGDESYYTENQIETAVSGFVSLPLLFKTATNHWALLSESQMETGNFSSAAGINSAGFITLISQSGIFRITAPFTTSWRVGIVGKDLKTIVESTLVDDVSTPSQISDTSWIKPGVAAWSWLANQGNEGSLSVQKQYVDLAAQMGWHYSTVDAGWKNGISDTSHQTAFAISDLVNYATPKNIGIIVWFHSNSLKDQVERDYWLPLLAQWGVKGLKVDFLDNTFGSDSVSANLFMNELAAQAAMNQLFVFWHGSSAPRGQQRTWPNVFAFEAVRGEEMYKYWDPPNPYQNTILPFTRNVVGSLDFTPMWFSTPNRTTTKTHELALAVVYESAIQHFGDTIAAYQAEPLAKQFLNNLPTAWDDTIFLDGYPGKYTVLARRKNTSWYLGGINNTPALNLSIPLNFLGSGQFQAVIYEDASPTVISSRTIAVSNTTTLPIALAQNAGVTITLTPLQTSTNPPLPGDLNRDGQVNTADIQFLLSQWNGAVQSDANNDAKLNSLDFGIVKAGM